MNLPANKKETALRAIASNKRYTAGLHVAAGRYLLGLEVVNDQLKRKRYTEEVQSEQENKKIDAHTVLANKVYAIRTLKKEPAEWIVAGANENNGNMVQASLQSSITNNEATSTYQIL